MHLLSDDSEIDDLIRLKNRPKIKDSVWTDLKQKTKMGKNISVKMDHSRKFQDRLCPVENFFAILVNKTDKFYLYEIRLHF